MPGEVRKSISFTNDRLDWRMITNKGITRIMGGMSWAIRLVNITIPLPLYFRRVEAYAASTPTGREISIVDIEIIREFFSDLRNKPTLKEASPLEKKRPV